jgi:hypothetical protein
MSLSMGRSLRFQRLRSRCWTGDWKTPQSNSVSLNRDERPGFQLVTAEASKVQEQLRDGGTFQTLDSDSNGGWTATTIQCDPRMKIGVESDRDRLVGKTPAQDVGVVGGRLARFRMHELRSRLPHAR